MKGVANVISISRIIFSIILIFVYKNQPLFILVYIICGFSDILDGYIARKTNSESLAGAKLDSAADLVMFGVTITIIIILIGDRVKIFFPWVIVIVLIRCINIIIGAYKYHSFIMLHTWGNKITGILVFMIPLVLSIFHSTAILWPVCIVSILSSIEESIIHITSNELDLNRRSIISK